MSSAPRAQGLAIGAGTTPEVVVAWNAKDQGTEIKVARSVDGGATFGAPGASVIHVRQLVAPGTGTSAPR